MVNEKIFKSNRKMKNKNEVVLEILNCNIYYILNKNIFTTELKNILGGLPLPFYTMILFNFSSLTQLIK